MIDHVYLRKSYFKSKFLNILILKGISLVAYGIATLYSGLEGQRKPKSEVVFSKQGGQW